MRGLSNVTTMNGVMKQDMKRISIHVEQIMQEIIFAIYEKAIVLNDDIKDFKRNIEMSSVLVTFLF